MLWIIYAHESSYRCRGNLQHDIDQIGERGKAIAGVGARVISDTTL